MSGVYSYPMDAEEKAGKYRTLLELGEGGTAHVYLAVAQGPSGFNKLVVMKTLKEELATDPEYQQMFLIEARLAARLNHPNIVQTNEVTDGEGSTSIIMEYLEGQPLSSIVMRARGRLPLAMRLRIIAEALAGLHYAHELRDYDGAPLRLVHRDVTPHNIFVTFEGQIKVLDFGIAKIATAGTHTQHGVLKGKIRYMAPEQIVGEEIDRRADIFSVGVMLWEAAVGDRLWKGLSDATVMNNVLNDKVPPPSSVSPDVPPELDRICRKALAHQATDRYDTAADLEADLEAFVSTLPDSHAANHRDIGKFTSELFADLRRQTKEIVASRLQRVTSLSWDEYLSKSFLTPPYGTFTQRTQTASALSPLQAPSVSKLATRRPLLNGMQRWVWFGCAALALVVAVVVRSAFVHHDASRASSLLQPKPVLDVGQAAHPTDPVPAPGSVTIRLQATPPEANLFFDGNRLPSNPYTGSLPKDQIRHVIRADAQGYTAQTEEIVLDKDTEYTFALERPKKSTHVVLPSAAPKPSAQPPRAPLPTSAPSLCSTPYYMDERGIKKVKPECM